MRGLNVTGPLIAHQPRYMYGGKSPSRRLAQCRVYGGTGQLFVHPPLLCEGFLVGVGVSVGGTGVSVGGSGVAVGGSGVAVGGSGVAVGVGFGLGVGLGVGLGGAATTAMSPGSW